MLRYSTLPRPNYAAWWPTLISTVAATLALWRERSRSRQYLATLDARGLADIGMSRVEQYRECAKPFWRN
jgi:uncharacterized protein YjiS (DUF1127 family)